VKRLPVEAKARFSFPTQCRTMLVAEIHSLLTKALCAGSDDEESNLAIAALQRLVVQEEHAVALHPEAEETAKRLVSSCHIFVYDVCSSVPRLHLGGISPMKDLIGLVLGNAVVEGEVEEDEDEEQDDDAKALTAFCNAWLDVMGLAVTGRLLEQIMRIPLLTKNGCEHLHANLGYLENVFSAIGVAGHPHPLLGHIAGLATVDIDIMLDRTISALDQKDSIASLLRSIEKRFVAMRGSS
jgi:hypothetical protein